MGRILMNGVVVVLGDRSEVDEGRKALAEFENLMLVESDLLRIPWRDQFFTKIVVPPHLESLLPQISAELQRLLAPQGEIVRSSLNV